VVVMSGHACGGSGGGIGVDARDRKPCAGKKRGVRLAGRQTSSRQTQGQKGSSSSSSVAGVAPTAV